MKRIELEVLLKLPSLTDFVRLEIETNKTLKYKAN